MKDTESKLLLQKAHALSQDIKEMEGIDVDKAYAKALLNIKRRRNKQLYQQIMKYAALFALPFFVTSLILGYLYFTPSAKNEKFIDVMASTGTIVRFELPDNSVVWLNSGSSLRYPIGFSKDARNVELRGEAYFDVQKDSDSPFQVSTTSGLNVRVFGTKFNVSAYDEDSTIETTLEEGSVGVILPAQKDFISLVPSDQLIYDKLSRGVIKNKVDIYEKMAWKDGKLIFRNASLEEIFKRLERHFNVDIQFANNSGNDYRYRATFRNETLNQILEYLAKSVSMSWEYDQEPAQQTQETIIKKKIKIQID